jgi:hypothetical protein
MSRLSLKGGEQFGMSSFTGKRKKEFEFDEQHDFTKTRLEKQHLSF